MVGTCFLFFFMQEYKQKSTYMDFLKYGADYKSLLEGRKAVLQFGCGLSLFSKCS